MKPICDLHTHSVFSDGTYTPTQILEEACRLGLCAVALCDHNTADGLEQFLAAAKQKNIKAIPGAEFTVDYRGKELHLVALFLPEDQFARVSQRMEEVNQSKEKSNRDLIARLNQAGYQIDYETIKNATPNGKFNRAHVAEELTKKGYTASVQEAFSTLLHPDQGYYQKSKHPCVFEMISFIRQMGAVSVIAHPFADFTFEEAEQFLPLAKEKGLDAMECFYSTYDEATTQKALELAKKYSLIPSGGSDFHGETKPKIRLGVGFGNLKIPYPEAFQGR